MWLGAQRALLLQLAHPAVAAAVGEHSGFRDTPHRRLWATADTMLRMVWGRPEEAVAARDAVLRIHDRVHGVLPEDAPPWRRGTPYSAHEMSLLRWVWATLVDSTEVVHDRYLGGLPPATAEAVHRDWVAFAVFFGLAADELPGDRDAFKASYERWTAALTVSTTARELAAAVVDPPLWWAPKRLRVLGRTVATALLPPAVRESYGLPWGPAEQAQARRVELVVGRVQRHLPEARLRLPDAYLALRRTVVVGQFG